MTRTKAIIKSFQFAAGVAPSTQEDVCVARAALYGSGAALAVCLITIVALAILFVRARKRTKQPENSANLGEVNTTAAPR